MEIGSTVGGRIKKQDPEAYKLLQNIIKRPGMYVGIGRFDYVDNLFTGYYIGRQSLGQEDSVNFVPHNELQYWLLHTQSASVDGNIHGRTLFYRCFGVREMAFENYKVFLNANLPKNPEDVYSELWDYINKNNIIDYSYLDEDLLEEELPSDYYNKLAQTVINNIKEMMSRANFIYDKLKVYVRKERLFNQVRFIFHGNKGWIDDSEIIAKPENHELLIEMHANVKSTSAEALRDCGCYVFDTLNYDDEVLPFGEMFTDEIAFHSKFLQWQSDNS